MRRTEFSVIKTNKWILLNLKEKFYVFIDLVLHFFQTWEEYILIKTWNYILIKKKKKKESSKWDDFSIHQRRV